MKKQLFNKICYFTDIHFGEKNNEKRHNDDCSNFVDWAIKRAQEENVDYIIFGGDWFHHRHQIHVGTLNYSKINLEKLNSCGIPVIMLLGNHDLYYKERRDVSSVNASASDLKNITIIDSIVRYDDVLFVPWVLNNELDIVREELKNCTYCFGHFELPHFIMNSLAVTPEKETGLRHEDFDMVKEWAFSGHYHIRQNKGKVFYTGNAFPMSFSDTWDDDRGIMILEYGKYPEFEKFKQAPKYRTINLSEMLEDVEKYIDDLTFIKITPDINVNYEDINILSEVIKNNFKPRKCTFLSPLSDQDELKSSGDIEDIESIDSIVINGINTIDSKVISKERLIDIWINN
ncbi:MAG: endonuclease subunit [Caudoviricetes sp.]|nr:MAG: endonuclease subunit [Caudoviricetes sp.]